MKKHLKLAFPQWVQPNNLHITTYTCGMPQHVGMTAGLLISSWNLCAFKLPLIKCICGNHAYIMPAHTMTPSHHGAHVHKADISKQLAHGTLYVHLPSARRSDSSTKRTLLQSARHHQRSPFAHSVTIINCCLIKTLVKTSSTQINFPGTFSGSVNSLVLQPTVASVGRVTVSDSRWQSFVEDVDVLIWQGYKWSAIVRLARCTAKFWKTTLKKSYGSEITIQAWSSGLVDIPVASMPTTHSLKAWNICGFGFCTNSAFWNGLLVWSVHGTHVK